MPTRSHLWFGEPMEFRGGKNENDDVVDGHVKKVKNTVQRMVEHG